MGLDGAESRIEWLYRYDRYRGFVRRAIKRVSQRLTKCSTYNRKYNTRFKIIHKGGKNKNKDVSKIKCVKQLATKCVVLGSMY